jgi:hypothetical protein
MVDPNFNGIEELLLADEHTTPINPYAVPNQGPDRFDINEEE